MSEHLIRLGDDVDGVELERLEFATKPAMAFGDLRLRVVANGDGFFGSYEQVWIAAADWAGFIQSLKSLEKDRTGIASVAAMSPNEFELHVAITDYQGGPVRTFGFLSRYVLRFGVSGEAVLSRLHFRTIIDPSMLSELVRHFEAFGREDGTQ